MLLKCSNILVQVEESRDEDLDLIIGQMGKCTLEQRRNVFLNVEDVAGDRTQVHRNLICFHERKHVREYLGVHQKICRV